MLATTVHFDDFAIDLRAGEIRKQGHKVKLQEKPFQILSALLERPGELVTREELRAKIWPAGVFVDFDHSLKTAIGKIRIALGDSAGRPRFVETLPRRGYRFIATVEPSVRDVFPTRRSLARARLAVLPFEDYSAEGTLHYLADGMTEEAIACLGGLCPDHLGVIARTSVMRYKRTLKTMEEIGAELKADHFVEGSIRSAQGRVRVTVQLIRASDQTHLWAESYEGELEGVLGLQRCVAQALAHEIEKRLLGGPLPPRAVSEDDHPS